MTVPDAELQRATTALRITAACTWIGLFSLYAKVWIEPRDATGELERWAGAVADGTAVAPYQYRFLVPDLLIWMHDHLGMSVGRAELLVDGILLAIAALGFDRLFEKLGRTTWVLPAATYACFLGLGILWWGKFETIAAFAALTWSCVALIDERRRSLLVVAVPVLLVCRTDLTAALGVAFLARWWLDRSRRDDRTIGLLLGIAAVAATVAFSRIWPDARYGEQGLVQVVHNLKPAVWLTALAFLAPVVAPWTLCRKGTRSRAAAEGERDVVVPLLALVAAEVVLTGLVGRIEEVRMFFPLAAPLAALGVIGWQAAFTPPPSPVAGSAHAEATTTA